MNKYLEKIASPYREGSDSTFTSGGHVYSVDKALELSDDLPVVQIPVKDLAWVLNYDKPDPERLKKADPKAPALVTYWNGQLVAVDGLHRLAKAIQLGQTHLPAKMLTSEMMANSRAI